MSEKWEYRVMELPNFEGAKIQAALDELGADGWELTATYVTPAAFNAFIFKRPKRGGPHEGGQYAGYEN
jgi:hypothetical protein